MTGIIESTKFAQEEFHKLIHTKQFDKKKCQEIQKNVLNTTNEVKKKLKTYRIM